MTDDREHVPDFGTTYVFRSEDGTQYAMSCADLSSYRSKLIEINGQPYFISDQWEGKWPEL